MIVKLGILRMINKRIVKSTLNSTLDNFYDGIVLRQ